MMAEVTHLVTGGSGYFGEIVVARLLKDGARVRIFDLNAPETTDERVSFVQGDIRDIAAVQAACKGVDTVFHNVAQVPLARDKDLFWSVNRDGTRNIVDACRAQNVRKLVYTSSSAVFGVPKSNPVTESTVPTPAEDYGRAKLAGEDICREASAKGLDASIIRPRTILGHGRLGVVQMLLDWVSRGLCVPVFGKGDNIYQFVHADDLAWACAAAAKRKGPELYNIGAGQFGTMRELLEAVCRHAGTGAKVKSLPMKPAELAANVASKLGLSPLGPYHALMYGRSLWFDISKAEKELGYKPQWSNERMICNSYDWYMAHRDRLKSTGASHHKSALKKGVLAFLPYFLKVLPS